MNLIAPIIGYIIVTFVYAYVWHLVLFRKVYDAIGIYDRDRPIIPIGVLTVIIQGVVVTLLFSKLEMAMEPVFKGAFLGLLLGLFEFSAGSLAFAAKSNIRKMRSWITIQLALSITLFPISGSVVGLIHSRL